jgi:ABC-2 type transport system permease protein
MNLNLFIQELKANMRGCIIAGLFAAAMLSMLYIIFSSMMEGGDMNRLLELYSTMPEDLQVAFNIQVDQWTSILGIHASYFVYYIPLMLGCYSAILGAKILAKEEQHKTAEFLLTRPVSRGEVVTSKLLSLIILITGFNVLGFITGWIGCGIVSGWNYNVQSLAVLHTYGLLICLFFSFLGIFLTVLMKRAKAITGIVIGIVMGAYFVDMILRISDKAQFLLFFTPFHYMNLDVLSSGYGFDAWRICTMIGVSVVLILLTHLLYRRRDILI